MRLKGKLVDWCFAVESEFSHKDSCVRLPQIGVIELEPGEIKVGDEVLVKVKVTRSPKQGAFMALDGYADERAFLSSDVVAVLPQELEKKEIEPIDPQKDSWEKLCYRFNELIKVVNEMRRKWI